MLGCASTTGRLRVTDPDHIENQIYPDNFYLGINMLENLKQKLPLKWFNNLILIVHLKKGYTN